MTAERLTALLAPYHARTVAVSVYISRVYLDRALAPYQVSR